jgi:ParB family chromosome partitioning protein
MLGDIGSLAELLNAGEQSTVVEVPLSHIDFDPDQPRKTIDHETLSELADSIRQHGVLQPVEVKRQTDGRYQLIWGERRVRAASIAGLSTVRAHVRAADELKTLILQLVENMEGLREKVGPLDEAQALDRLISLTGSAKAAAEKISKSETYVSHRIKLLDLPSFVIKLYRDGITSDVDVLVTLGKLAAISEPAAITLCEQSSATGVITRDQVRTALVEAKLAQKSTKQQKMASTVVTRREAIKSLRSVRDVVAPISAATIKGDEDMTQKVSRIMELLDEILSASGGKG